ncbi:MAG: sortase [Ruminococcus sp.]|nr:sortase [Ruminococcus sp.]
MNDKYLEKLNEERAIAEALEKAEKIKAIRASLHGTDDSRETAASIAEQTAEPAAYEEDSFAEKFRRVKESRLSAMNQTADVPVAEAVSAETADAENNVIRQVLAENMAAGNVLSEDVPTEAETAEMPAFERTVSAEAAAENVQHQPEVQSHAVQEAAVSPMKKPREAWAQTPHTEPRIHTEQKKKKKKKKKKTLGQRLRGLFPEKGDKPLEKARKIIFLCSLVVIVICGYYVGDYTIDLWRSRMEYSSIDDMYRTYTPIIASVEEDEPLDDKYYDLLPGAKKLLDINPEVIGYLTIPTVNGEPTVSLPVVQAADNSKYLDLNFKGEESRAGALFLDWRNSFDKVEDHRLVEKNSDNLIVYGHNMADESMFGTLKYYRRNENYYENHPIIEFNSNYEQYTYKIFSFFLLDAEDDTDTEYDCWNTLNFDDEEEFYDFVNEAKRRTLRTNDVDVRYGDPLLTVSTCNTDVIGDDRGRLILMARRVRPGEELYEGTKNSKANPNIKWPNVYYESRPNEKYDAESFVPYGPVKSENTKANNEE